MDNKLENSKLPKITNLNIELLKYRHNYET